MKRNYTYIILCAVMMFITACYDDPGTDIVIGNEAYLELDRAGQPNPSVSMEFNQDPDGTTAPQIMDVQVNILGRVQKTNVTAAFEVDPSSTAIAGVHYNVLTTGAVTIPAGSTSADIEIQVLPDGFDPDNDTAPWTLIFRLTGGDLPLSKYVQVTYNLSGKCAYALSTFTGLYNSNEPGYGNYDVHFTADAAANTVINDNFWDAGAVIKYVFDPATETVTIPSQEFTSDIGSGPETLIVTGTGTFSACTGDFAVNYTVKRKSNNSTVDSNKHTFTKK
jgi:hypothetical protein